MPEIPRTKFNSPWTVAVIEAALNDVSSAKGSSESLTAALNAMRADEAEDKSALVELVDGGSKNKLLYDGIGTPTAPETLTFTHNADGSITVNGSTGANETAYVFLQYNAGNIDVKDFANDCIISGVPSGTNGLSLRCNSGNTTYGIDTGSGGLIQYTGTAALSVLVFVSQNTTISNVTVKPMICTKAAWDISTAFVPYRPSWQKMWDEIGTKTSTADVFGRGIPIQNGDNLDDYLTVGRYYAPNGTIAASLSNCPVITGFTLVVAESFQVSGGVVQTIETVVSGGYEIDIYKRIRVYRAGVWLLGDWNKYGGAVQTRALTMQVQPTEPEEQEER